MSSSESKNGFIYVINACNTNYYKIGVTSHDPLKRLSQLQVGCPHNLQLMGTYSIICENDVYDVEKHLHEVFSECRVRGEWFELSNSEDVAYVLSEMPVHNLLWDDKVISTRTVRTSPKFNKSLEILNGSSNSTFLKLILIIWCLFQKEEVVLSKKEKTEIEKINIFYDSSSLSDSRPYDTNTNPYTEHPINDWSPEIIYRELE